MLGSQGRAMPSPSYMSEEQTGQQSHASPSSIQARRALFGSSRSGECPAVQQEGDSHSVPTASYLRDLRTNKTRPVGSRPPPPSKFGSLRRTETETTTTTQQHARDDTSNYIAPQASRGWPQQSFRRPSAGKNTFCDSIEPLKRRAHR
jgi:hypothetical protein